MQPELRFRGQDHREPLGVGREKPLVTCSGSVQGKVLGLTQKSQKDNKMRSETNMLCIAETDGACRRPRDSQPEVVHFQGIYGRTRKYATS